MIFLQANWIIAFVFAFTLYGAGKAEARDSGRNNGFLWAGLSIAASALLIQLLGAGWFVVVLGQVALFAGIAIFRSLRK
jgi:biotin transporter BioY